MSDWLPERLPEDPEAEKALLSTLFGGGGEEHAEEILPLLVEDDFVHPAHRAVLKAGREIFENGGEINPLTLKDALDRNGDLGRVGAYPGLIELLSAEEVGRPMVLVNILRRKRKLRGLIRMSAGMVRAAAEETDDPDTLMAGYVEDLSGEIGDSKKLKVSSYLGAAKKASAGQALLVRERVNNLVRIGIPTIDANLTARAGSLGIIAGKSSVGKSALAIQLQAKTPDSLLLSLEMEDEEVEARLLSHHTGLDAEGFLKGTHGAVDVDEEIFQQAHKITEFKTRDFGGILAMVRACVRKLGIRVVIVDYFQLLDPPAISGASVAYRLGKMSAMFKAMAKDLGIAVVLLSQFNREVADGERPKLENLKETGGLEQDANWVLMAWTEKPDYQPDENRILFMELAKNRGGKRWIKARTEFRPGQTRFVEAQNTTEPRLIKDGATKGRAQRV